MSNGTELRYMYLPEVINFYTHGGSYGISHHGENMNRNSLEFFKSNVLYMHENLSPACLSPTQTEYASLEIDPRWVQQQLFEDNDKVLRKPEHYYLSSLNLVDMLAGNHSSFSAETSLDILPSDTETGQGALASALKVTIIKTMEAIDHERELNKWLTSYNKVLEQKAEQFLYQLKQGYLTAEGYLTEIDPEEDYRNGLIYDVSTQDEFNFQPIPAEAWIDAEHSWREASLIIGQKIFLFVRFPAADIMRLGLSSYQPPQIGARQKRWDIIFKKMMVLTNSGKTKLQQNLLASLLKEFYNEEVGKIGIATIKKRLKQYRADGIIK